MTDYGLEIALEQALSTGERLANALHDIVARYSSLYRSIDDEPEEMRSARSLLAEIER